MKKKKSAEPAEAARCSRCGSSFYCGMQTGVENCWCARLPPIEPTPGRGCLCRACLEEKLKASKNVTR